MLCGHVHDPVHWRQRDDTMLFLNPGRAADAEIPNHILVRTDDLSCRFFGVEDRETAVSDAAVMTTERLLSVD